VVKIVTYLNIQMHKALLYKESPIGLLVIRGEDEYITAVYFVDEKKEEIFPSLAVRQCALQLEEYFAGKRKDFDLPLRPEGTGFQSKVWAQLQHIPFGETISYLTLAKQLGDPKCIRAAGSANGKNPVSIIIPCHRVIGSNGKMIGYGGGLWRKKWLLNHENALSGNDLFNSVPSIAE
jgi:methylated-DNA-[protein]-cysteine S-methyltransferase